MTIESLLLVVIEISDFHSSWEKFLPARISLHQETMPPKKAQTTMSDSDKSVLLSVYRILKWKGLKATANRLSQEAELLDSAVQQYTPELASADWARLQRGPKVDPRKESESSSSEESDSESEGVNGNNVNANANNC
jgi:hypothetical protein